MKKSLEVSLLTLFLFAFELFIYSAAKMQLAASGTPASFIAYSFQWLMALTVAIGVAFPAGEFAARKSGLENMRIIFTLGILLVMMAGFTAVSFLKASSAKSTPSSAAKISPGKSQQDVSESIEFADSEVKEISPDILEMEFKFKNKSNQDITELDYVFIAVENVRVFYKIKIREGVYFPSKGAGSTKLTWDRSKLKSPELFDTLKRTYASKTLKVFAKATRITLIDGSVIGD